MVGRANELPNITEKKKKISVNWLLKITEELNVFYQSADEVLRISLALIVLIVSVAPGIIFSPDQIAPANNSKGEDNTGIANNSNAGTAL